MPIHSDAEVIEAVARHSARSAAAVHQKMKRGLSRLASIAATAPFVGLFGTAIGIENAFGGLGTEKWAAIAAITGGISQALAWTALGLLVAIIASCFYTYLSNRLETIDMEMQNASLELVNRLILYRPR